jgi:hypothetical protein
MPEEPVLKKFWNIECRDAVLAYDGDPQPVTRGHGRRASRPAGVARSSVRGSPTRS